MGTSMISAIFSAEKNPNREKNSRPLSCINGLKAMTRDAGFPDVPQDEITALGYCKVGPQPVINMSTWSYGVPISMGYKL